MFIRGREEKIMRKLISATVQFNAETTFKDNLFQAVDWKKAINLQAKRELES